MIPLDARLLALLVCPACKGPLAAAAQGLNCKSCRKTYPIKDGIVDFLA